MWLLSGPEILGPENDQIVWSLSGPGRCLVLLHRDFLFKEALSPKNLTPSYEVLSCLVNVFTATIED